MAKIDPQKQVTLTDADFERIGSIIEGGVGKRLSAVEQTLDGAPPKYEGGLKTSVSKAWDKINSHTAWRNTITGVFIVIVFLVSTFGFIVFEKLDDVLITVSQFKAAQAQTQNKLPEHKP